jgi:hypothetical protein
MLAAVFHSDAFNLCCVPPSRQACSKLCIQWAGGLLDVVKPCILGLTNLYCSCMLQRRWTFVSAPSEGGIPVVLWDVFVLAHPDM